MDKKFKLFIVVCILVFSLSACKRQKKEFTMDNHSFDEIKKEDLIKSDWENMCAAEGKDGQGNSGEKGSDSTETEGSTDGNKQGEDTGDDKGQQEGDKKEEESEPESEEEPDGSKDENSSEETGTSDSQTVDSGELSDDDGGVGGPGIGEEDSDVTDVEIEDIY